MIRKTFFLNILLCFFAFQPLHAFDLADSLQEKAKNHLSFVFKLDNRFSFAREQMITIHGFRTGFKWNNKHEIGLALNWLGSTNTFEIPVNISVGEQSAPAFIPMEGKLFYKYAGFFYEYNFYRKKRWTMSIPLQLGGGRAGVNINNYSKDNEFMQRREGKFMLFEPALTIDYKIIRFAGIGTGVGYRFAFSEQNIVKQHLTQPVFIIKAKIYLGEIFRSVRKKDYRFFYFE